jgi:hypothetical protein
MQTEQLKMSVDGLSIGTIILSLFDKMPSIAAFAAFVWTLIRIWETETVQKIIRRFRA